MYKLIDLTRKLFWYPFSLTEGKLGKVLFLVMYLCDFFRLLPPICTPLYWSPWIFKSLHPSAGVYRFLKYLHLPTWVSLNFLSICNPSTVLYRFSKYLYPLLVASVSMDLHGPLQDCYRLMVPSIANEIIYIKSWFFLINSLSYINKLISRIVKRQSDLNWNTMDCCSL